jgi:hypothetical protein
MHEDELRRTERVKICCRVDVRDRFGVWTAITDDVCARGCRLVATKCPRVGSLLALTLSSDLFPEVLDVTARVAWVSDHRVGLAFVSSRPRPTAIASAEWVARLVESGSIHRPEPVGAIGHSLVPAVRRPTPGRPGVRPVLVKPREDSDAEILPLQHG